MDSTTEKIINDHEFNPNFLHRVVRTVDFSNDFFCNISGGTPPSGIEKSAVLIESHNLVIIKMIAYFYVAGVGNTGIYAGFGSGILNIPSAISNAANFRAKVFFSDSGLEFTKTFLVDWDFSDTISFSFSAFNVKSVYIEVILGCV